MIRESKRSFLWLMRAWWAAAAILITLAGQPDVSRAQQTLNVYSALDEDHFAEIMAAFEAKYPDIKTNKIIDSNGPIIARLLAEKDNPQADILLGAAASGLLVLHKAGVLEGYKPADFDKIKPKLRDQQNDPPVWVGMDAWASAICFNTTEGTGQNVAQPATWNDLLKPEYEGKIIMPNPNSSGTGFLTVAGWLKLFGEDGGWAYMDKLHRNISQYVHSGSKPCRMAAAGETLVGISYAFPGVKAINDGAPLTVILPDEGIGAEIEAAALIKGGKNPEAARLLADFAASEEGNIISNKYYVVVGREGISTPIPNYPEGEEQKMLDMDFVWLADNRERILDEWQKRYGVKDAPKD
jgi:iron(III) transport system substrate-binding protein